jgi:hypothetical protein
LLLPSRYSEQGAIDYKTADRKATKEMLTKVIQLPSVQNEVCTYVHMLLTYLFARYSESSTVAASAKMVIKAGEDPNAAALAMSSGGNSNRGSSNQDYASAFVPAGIMSQQQMQAGGGGGNPFTGSTVASESVGAPVTMPGKGGTGAGGVPSRGGLASNMMAQKSGINAAAAAAGAPATGKSLASSGMGGIKFNKANMPKDKPRPPPPAKAGDPRSNQGTGEYGNVFFAAGGDAPEVMSLLPSPKEKPKVDPKLPTFMQPVPKKKDRR